MQELAQERTTSLVPARRHAPLSHDPAPIAMTPRPIPTPPLRVRALSESPSNKFPSLAWTGSHATEAEAVRSQATRCRFCRSVTHLEEDCEEADTYIRAGKCRRDVERKIVLPSGARIPRNIMGGTLQDWLEEYYRPKVAQVSVPGIATRRQVSATATEARRPALPSHSKIAQEAIEPTDDYQTPKTPILSNPEPRVVPASVADTISNPPESSASERTNAPCGILPPVGNSRVIALTSIPAHAVSNDCIPVAVCDIADPRAEASTSHSVPLVPSNVSSRIPGPEWPQSTPASFPCDHKSATMAAMRSKVGPDGREVVLASPSGAPPSSATMAATSFYRSNVSPRSFRPSTATQYLRWSQQLPPPSSFQSPGPSLSPCPRSRQRHFSGPERRQSALLASVFQTQPEAGRDHREAFPLAFPRTAHQHARVSALSPHANAAKIPAASSNEPEPSNYSPAAPRSAQHLDIVRQTNDEVRSKDSAEECSGKKQASRQDTRAIPTVPSRASSEDWGQSDFQRGGEPGSQARSSSFAFPQPRPSRPNAPAESHPDSHQHRSCPSYLFDFDFRPTLLMPLQNTISTSPFNPLASTQSRHCSLFQSLRPSPAPHRSRQRRTMFFPSPSPLHSLSPELQEPRFDSSGRATQRQCDSTKDINAIAQENPKYVIHGDSSSATWASGVITAAMPRVRRPQRERQQRHVRADIHGAPGARRQRLSRVTPSVKSSARLQWRQQQRHGHTDVRIASEARRLQRVLATVFTIPAAACAVRADQYQAIEACIKKSSSASFGSDGATCARTSATRLELGDRRRQSQRRSQDMRRRARHQRISSIASQERRAKYRKSSNCDRARVARISADMCDLALPRERHAAKQPKWKRTHNSVASARPSATRLGDEDDLGYWPHQL
ncbi:hypothetical protein EDB85DRAFT_2200845 [Lactarius pseudohatsudake]|nr:hypothetical protein EDB85DRAFT_2200845 [Lactarius pseudohatsudake]